MTTRTPESSPEAAVLVCCLALPTPRPYMWRALCSIAWRHRVALCYVYAKCCGMLGACSSRFSLGAQLLLTEATAGVAALTRFGKQPTQEEGEDKDATMSNLKSGT